MSLGDSLAGLHATLGVLLSLVAKNKLSQNQAERTGQVVDVAIYESMLNMMESVVPEYDRFNQVKSKVWWFSELYWQCETHRPDPPAIWNYVDRHCSYKYVSL